MLVALLGIAVAPTPAAAQDRPPYGGTSTTGRPSVQPTCQLRTRVAAPGETATVRLRDVPRGERVEIRLDGEVVAEATASPPGRAPLVTFEVDFAVPTDTEPGRHAVTAVGAAFTASCQTANGDDLEVASAEVLGATTERGSGGGGSLPRTGMYVALLAALAAGLVVVGRAVLAESRRRARSATIDLSGRHPRTPRR